MTREDAIEVLENGDWWEELTEWYMVVHPEHDKLRDAVDMAISALRQQETVTNRNGLNEPLTLDDLSKRNDPVFVSIKDFPNGGYWCLCQNGYIIPPSGYGFMAKDRPNWVFYRQKPEEGTV